MVEDIISALRRVAHPRFFETERGFQGAFQANLTAALGDLLPPKAILEEEYQKRISSHGIRRRPDVIIHVPTPPGGNRRAGNFAVFALKRQASSVVAQQDFEALDAMFEALDYPFGAFINIGLEYTHADQYRGGFSDRIHFFAVWHGDGQTHVSHARICDGRLIEMR